VKKRNFIIVLLAIIALVTSVRTQAGETAGVNLTITVGPFCGNGVAETGEQCDGSQLRGKTCASINFGSGSLTCSALCQFNTSGCVTGATATSTPYLFSHTNVSEYTFYDSNNSAKIVIPENFYGQDLTFNALSYDKTVFQSTKPPPSGKNFVGKTYDFVFIDPDGGPVSTISQPATLTLTYTDDDISGITESSLAPYRRGSGDASWQLISGATVDTANKKVTFSTANFSSFALIGSPAPSCGDGACNGSETCSSCSPDCGICSSSRNVSSSGGGGGGGGVLITAGTGSVVFSGKAYPKSTITLLKDAQVAASTIAGIDSNFQVSLSGLSAGNFIFSIYGEDKDGQRSSLFSFTVSISANATTNVTGIFIAPTIAVDKSEVKRGDNIAIFGQSAPSADIVVQINSDEEFYGKIKADKDGVYLYNFDTSPLDYGSHSTKSKAALAGSLSSFSSAVGFKIGTKNVLAPKVAANKVLKGDIQGDGKVNLIDFSIVAYWYKRANPPAKVDLNGDGKVDLIDLSIMAYYWTG